MATHPLLQAFKAAKPAFGAWLTVPGLWTARTAALASPHLSWLAIDCEHGLIPLVPGAAETIAAIPGGGSNAPTVIVRIPATGACADGSATWQIKYVLDAGARGIIVPMVSKRLKSLKKTELHHLHLCRYRPRHRHVRWFLRPDFPPKGLEDLAVHSHRPLGAYL